MARYFEYLKSFIASNQITHIFCHNDLRWQHAIAKVVSKEMHVIIFFKEEGLFRPDTLTMDSHGVNANSSVPSKKDFYQDQNFLPSTEFLHVQASYFIRSIRLLRFVMFLILNQLGDWFGLNVRPKNKQYVFQGYFKLFLKKLGKKTRPVSEEKPNFEYIFVPLQVTNDTQTVVHSPFSGTQEFINQIQKSYFALPTEIQARYKLVFKKHPMEEHVDYVFDSKSIISKAGTPDLVRESAVVVLINSTVIVDALKAGRPVITLGESFFNIEGLTIRSKLSTLTDDIVKCLTTKTSPDQKLLKNFLDFLKFRYQINGNIFYYDDSTIKRIASRIANESF
jgi:capsular polysaccharide export protein